MQTDSITIIGAGGVATNIGKLLQSKGNPITEILGHSDTSTRALADALGCSYTLDPKAINQVSDFYIIAIQDRAIQPLLTKIKIPATAMVVHTAGGVSIDVFKGYFEQYGVLYPLQSLRKETSVIPEIPFYLDANSQDAKSRLEAFTREATLDYRWADDRQRMQLHIAAVLCSNFPNYLYALAEKYCQDQGLEFATLLPVLEETSNRLAREKISPALLQTGPAIRQDRTTIDKHFALLEVDSDILSVYRYLTEQIMASKIFKK